MNRASARAVALALSPLLIVAPLTAVDFLLFPFDPELSGYVQGYYLAPEPSAAPISVPGSMRWTLARRHEPT